MTVIAIVLLIALGLLYSEYSAKARRVKQLEDILTIAQNTTGFWYTFNEVVRIYRTSYDGKHPINFDGVQEALNNFMEYNIYRQVYSDIEGVNELQQYQGLGLAGSHRLQEVFDAIEDEKVDEPETLKDWYTLVNKKKRA